MEYLPQSYLADEVSSDDEIDEIDELFYRLEPIDPPPSLVARIMEAVARLPLPTPESPCEPEERIAGLLIQPVPQQPS